MKLYYSPGACSLAVHIALCEVNAEFHLERVHLPQKRLDDGSDYLQISPQGYVPVLEFLDGSRHTETAALLQWVAERETNLRLIGSIGSDRRMAVLRWLNFVATELHKAFSPWLWQADIAVSTQNLVRAKLQDRFAEVETVLSRRESLADHFSVADAYAFTSAELGHLSEHAYGRLSGHPGVPQAGWPAAGCGQSNAPGRSEVALTAPVADRPLARRLKGGGAAERLASRPSDRHGRKTDLALRYDQLHRPRPDGDVV